MRAALHKPASLLSLEEWGNLDEDEEGELVDGVLEEEEMATILHELVVGWFVMALRLWAASHRAQVFGSEVKIAIAPRRGRKPDVSLFTTERPKLTETVVHARPFLVLEVLSPRPSDVRRDRIDKLRDYAIAGARHYWIVDPQMRTLEMLRLERGAYVHVPPGKGERVRPVGFPGLLLDLGALWGEVEGAERAEKRRGKK